MTLPRYDGHRANSFNTVVPIDNLGDWGCFVHDLETIIVLVLHSISSRKGHIQFHPENVTPLTNQDEVMIQGL